MTLAQKKEAMDRTAYDLNQAKDRMDSAVYTLEAHGMWRDAEQLRRIILKVEQFQNKYDRFSVYNRIK